ncbi:PAS domain S-box protein [Gordonia jinghuaiqii]|uniref:protein-glutamate O-methyltransferase n=1 Tax=Gordonia jinghuaiqii TaxID=2758710 RepID=A0A7D7QZI7_9ACTN|nr:CheR family methyltransferase [Gordonia jinghuaiqii]MCR5978356.1 PAS domain S-box protein [Gordonia jinghuaiqii]QMT01211.1 PAS domain S-box protein [Gordonia jinghuaiqii]
MSVENGEDFEALLTYLRDTRGFDFTGYKRTSLMRRVHHRMGQVGIESFTEYLDHLQASADEFGALFNTILINVTAFFRDEDAWQSLRNTVIPQLLAQRGPDDPIRVWSAGCASGQEAYSLAMLLAEAVGAESFRQRVKIYATDIDEEALDEARQASYDRRAVENIPPDLLEAYFEKDGSRYVFTKELRRGVIFGRNDLVQDAPISRIDLLVCRNTLMYFNAETQRRVLGRLHFALAPQGILFLGHAEMLLSHSDRFTPFDLKNRLFRKSARFRGAIGNLPVESELAASPEAGGLSSLRDLAFRHSPVAQLVVTGDDTVAMVNQQAELMFGLSGRDIGRLLRDLEVSYRPTELRGYVEQAKVERRSSRIRDVEWSIQGGQSIWLEVHINPLVDAENGLLGVAVAFFDVSAMRALLDKLEDANRQLETAYEELQSTNEELETTNEELQSTVEELETTNEELQSTNEELETMNEELQSTNDELQAINSTLGERTVELSDAREFFDSIINSAEIGIIVVDRDMRITVWNLASEEMWGVSAAETTGQPLLGLDIGLPTEDLRPMVGNAFVDPSYTDSRELDAINRRGRTVRIRIRCSPFRSRNHAIRGAMLVVESVESVEAAGHGDSDEVPTP